MSLVPEEAVTYSIQHIETQLSCTRTLAFSAATGHLDTSENMMLKLRTCFVVSAAVALKHSLSATQHIPNKSVKLSSQPAVGVDADRGIDGLSMPVAPTEQISRLTSCMPPPVLELPGDTIQELPSHKIIVLGTTAIAATNAAHAAAQLPQFDIACLFVVALIFADFLTGIFHWATDNYGSLETPLVGTACAAFQGHHRHPYTIVHRSFCNNVFKIGKIVAPLIALSFLLHPAPSFFLTVTLYCQMLSQEFHKFSHMPPSRHPPFISMLQNANLIISTKEHSRHHSSPYDGHYCILNGWCNPILDKYLFFRRLEVLFYRHFDVEPNCWKEDIKGAAVKAQALSLEAKANAA